MNLLYLFTYFKYTLINRIFFLLFKFLVPLKYFLICMSCKFRIQPEISFINLNFDISFFIPCNLYSCEKCNNNIFNLWLWVFTHEILWSSKIFD